MIGRNVGVFDVLANALVLVGVWLSQTPGQAPICNLMLIERN
jgi:hypothetical protein